MKKISALIVSVTLMLAFTAASENVVKMYALDGKTIEVYASEVYAYEQVGWYDSYYDVVAPLYAPDGRSIVVYKAEIDTYTALGWFTAREITMYAPDGTEQSVPIADIAQARANGLSEDINNVRINMFSEDGRVITVYRSEVPAYENVGWFEKSPAYFRTKPYFTDYSDLDVSGIRMGISYGELLESFSQKIIKREEVRYSDYHEEYCFDVSFDNAELAFMSTNGNINDIYAYRLFYFATTDKSYVFGRGISIGKSVSFIKERVPQAVYSENHTGYIFDSAQNAVSEYYGNDFPIYAMNEEYGFMSLFYGYTWYPAQLLKIYFEDGAITKLELFDM